MKRSTISSLLFRTLALFLSISSRVNSFTASFMCWVNLAPSTFDNWAIGYNFCSIIFLAICASEAPWFALRMVCSRSSMSLRLVDHFAPSVFCIAVSKPEVVSVLTGPSVISSTAFLRKVSNSVLGPGLVLRPNFFMMKSMTALTQFLNLLLPSSFSIFLPMSPMAVTSASLCWSTSVLLLYAGLFFTSVMYFLPYLFSRSSAYFL